VARATSLDEKRGKILDDFLYKFSLSRVQLNEIQKKFIDNGKNLHKATCDWLKENNELWKTWVEDLPMEDEPAESTSFDVIMYISFGSFVAVVLLGWLLQYLGVFRCMAENLLGDVSGLLIGMAWKFLDFASTIILWFEYDSNPIIYSSFKTLFIIFLAFNVMVVILNTYFAVSTILFLTSGEHEDMVDLRAHPYAIRNLENIQYTKTMCEYQYNSALAGCVTFVLEDISGVALLFYALTEFDEGMNNVFVVVGIIIQCVEAGISSFEPLNLWQSYQILEEHKMGLETEKSKQNQAEEK